MPPKKVYRARGLQCPLNTWQVLVICFHMINAILFYFVVSLKFDIAYFSIYTFFCTIAVGAWFYTSLVDAAVPPSKCERLFCLSMYCFKSANLKKRYCAVTRKTVPGMDHYCRWMNTAIGSRNYVGFFTVISSSTMLFTFQGIFAVVYFINNNNNTEDISSTNVVLLNVCSILLLLGSFGGLSSHGILFMFHCYLIKNQFGTYDFLIIRSKQKRVKMKKMKELTVENDGVVAKDGINTTGSKGIVIKKSNKVQSTESEETISNSTTSITTTANNDVASDKMIDQ